jgi:hypothetical protein
VRGWGMGKRIAPFGVVSLVLWAVCGAVCQSRESLPDAPSVQAETRAQRLNFAAGEARLPVEFGATDQGEIIRRSAFAAQLAFSQKPSPTIFEKYLKPSSIKQSSHYDSTAGGSLMGRATVAASRMVVTRDQSGKARLNTSYLLRTLTSVAADTASRPYWRRSAGEPFSDFGSTVGNDAGMNLWHEFGPSLEQVMKSHTPQFVSRIEQRIGYK